METSNKLLSTCQKGLDKLLSKLTGMDLEQLQYEMEEVNFKPEGLDYGEDYRWCHWKSHSSASKSQTQNNNQTKIHHDKVKIMHAPTTQNMILSLKTHFKVSKLVFTFGRYPFLKIHICAHLWRTIIDDLKCPGRWKNKERSKRIQTKMMVLRRRR